MKITSVIKKENIIFELNAATKSDVIDELITALSNSKQVKNIKKLKEAVLEREEVLSTAIGKGLAIPHCRTDAVDGIVMAFGKAKVPIDFGSLDNKPVVLIFLLASNENMNVEHLKLLRQISSIAGSDELLSRIGISKDSEDIYNILTELDYSTLLINKKL